MPLELSSNGYGNGILMVDLLGLEHRQSKQFERSYEYVPALD
jgi:hypothetical protein